MRLIPIPQEDAFVAAWRVRESPDRELWLDGRPVPKLPLAAGTTAF
jgi:hypothetical protein